MENSELRPAIYKSLGHKRKVLFHKWGETISDERLPITIAIVEDVETGEIFQVDPDKIQFTDRK